jgi:hypothetical protein
MLTWRGWSDNQTKTKNIFILFVLNPGEIHSPAETPPRRRRRRHPHARTAVLGRRSLRRPRADLSERATRLATSVALELSEVAGELSANKNGHLPHKQHILQISCRELQRHTPGRAARHRRGAHGHWRNARR